MKRQENNPHQVVERILGNGYPTMKIRRVHRAAFPNCRKYGPVLEFSSGKITGNKFPLKSIIVNMKNKSYIPGLEFDFGDMIYNSLVTLINADKLVIKKAA